MIPRLYLCTTISNTSNYGSP